MCWEGDVMEVIKIKKMKKRDCKEREGKLLN
jgi:hypothetical protein